MEHIFRPGGVICAYSDPGWVGCPRARKSTSAGILCIGVFMIKHWLSTQKAIAVSSAEAEVHAATRELREAKGLKPMRNDIGERLSICSCVDAQATIGLRCHAGFGKARDLETAGFWIQDALDRRVYDLCNIASKLKPAGALTKTGTCGNDGPALAHLNKIRKNKKRPTFPGGLKPQKGKEDMPTHAHAQHTASAPFLSPVRAEACGRLAAIRCCLAHARIAKILLMDFAIARPSKSIRPTSLPPQIAMCHDIA